MCLFLLRLSRRIDPPPRSTSEHAIERPMTHRTSNTLSGSPPAVRSVVYGWSCAALVLYPKERPFWVTGAHRGARGTLDEFKAAWGGLLPHDGGPPKILWGNLVPAAITDRRIGLQPYAPRGRGWLVCNLAYTTDRHRVLQEVDARPAELANCSLRGSHAPSRRGDLCPCPTTKSVYGSTGPCHKGTVKEL